VYDAITTDRSYRDAASPDQALQELQRNAGTQFDPAVVAALEAHLEGLGLVASQELAEVLVLPRRVA